MSSSGIKPGKDMNFSMTFEEKLSEYAKLTVRTCGNVTQGGYVLLSCPVHAARFGRMIAGEAYAAGAKDVIMLYYDEEFSRLRFLSAALEVFKSVPAWQAEQRNFYAREGCVSISVLSEDPDIFSGVPDAKLTANAIARKNAFKEFYDIMDKGGLRWTLVAYPCEKWAEKVFPDSGGEDAVSKLWDAIFATCRLTDANTSQKWERQDKLLKRRAEILNKYAFRELRYKNSLGTDFTVGLPDGHIWAGGSETSSDGVSYMPNMPTEEIFTMPHRQKAQGTVYASMPLSYQGTLIDEFYLTFKDGAVADYDAKKGKSALKRLLDTDEGSKRLGEVALIPYDSPISNLGILFYNTLFDENASCHIALGECYPMNIQNGANMTEKELLEHGGNKSVNHVDFMIGTKDLQITGVTKEGTKVPVFINGNFTF